MFKTLAHTVLFSLASVAALAQGINFEKGDWKSVQAKAAQEKKLIYLDVFTVWCGPCKMMAARYFPDPKAGTYYNEHFVNYQIDAEKGEGIEVAARYQVTGYPTNLFLDPATGNVVYRTMGVPGNVEAFVNNGAMALAEMQDPLTPEGYTKKFNSGKYDRAFLKKFMEKNKRLNQSNDAAVDAYLKKYAKQPLDDSTLLFIDEYQTGVENEGYRVLAAYAARLDALKSEGYFRGSSGMRFFNSMEKAKNDKDEAAFNRLLKRVPEFEPIAPQMQAHFFEDRFYAATGQDDKRKASNRRYVSYLLGLSKEAVAEQTGKQKEQLRQQLKSQIAAMGVPEAQAEMALNSNMERPEVKYYQEVVYAAELNKLAWAVYEQNLGAAPDKAAVAEALTWAKKGMELSEPSANGWVAVADTYAHLLALQGDKAAAKAMERNVIEKAKASGIAEAELAEFEEFVKGLD